jgi:hypothetical protein
MYSKPFASGGVFGRNDAEAAREVTEGRIQKISAALRQVGAEDAAKPIFDRWRELQKKYSAALEDKSQTR